MSDNCNTETGIPQCNVVGLHSFPIYVYNRHPSAEKNHTIRVRRRYGHKMPMQVDKNMDQKNTRSTERNLGLVLKVENSKQRRQEQSTFGKNQKTQDCSYAAPKDQRNQHLMGHRNKAS